MELIAFFLVAIFIITVIIVNVLYRSAKKVNHKKSYVLEDLGIQPRHELKEDVKALAQHLESSFVESYVERVKERVIREHKIGLTEWENRFFEWKRYLVMTAILKKVPMYSDEVDEIWHEMLMFTREYEEFSNRYLGTVLHHEPNLSGQSLNTEERSFFDLIYLLLFRPTKYSHHTWGAFFQHPLSKSLLNDFKHCSDMELKDKYFNPHAGKKLDQAACIIENLIRIIKRKLEQAEKHVVNHGTSVKEYRRQFKKYGSAKDDPVLGAIFLSLYHSDTFYGKYHELYKRFKEDDSSFVIYSAYTPAHHHHSGNESPGGNGGESGSSGDGSSCGSSI